MVEVSTIQQVAVALSAIIATITIIYKVVDDSKSRQQKDLLDWQKTVVHSIFQKSKTEWLSFEHIINAYRGEAADVPGQNIPKDVLTSAALRKILIAMVAERIIDQKGGDQYQLMTFNRQDQLKATMLDITSSSMTPILESMLNNWKELKSTSGTRHKEMLDALIERRQQNSTDNNEGGSSE